MARCSVLAPAMSSGCGRPMQSAPLRSKGGGQATQVLPVLQLAVSVDDQDHFPSGVANADVPRRAG